MLDLKYVIANLDAVRENCRNRAVPADVLEDLDRIADLEADRRRVLSTVEDVRRRQNEVAQSTGKERDAARRADRDIEVSGGVALVAGDRQTDGVFPLWTIAENITIASLARLRRGFLIDRAKTSAMAETWKARIAIRTPDVDNPILSLSGGNQQKALFARALGSTAETVLMDDPMRGVDIGTKQEVYDMIRAEAAGGRTFLWYTTEMDELRHCDHVYVFRDQHIVADLSRGELTEEKILHASFAEVA